MKKLLFTCFVSLFVLFNSTESSAQFKVHNNGRISFLSTTNIGGVQIDTLARCCFEPFSTTSGSHLTKTVVQTQLVKSWVVRFSGSPMLYPIDRFYVTGAGDTYAQDYYNIDISRNGGESKAFYPIENPSELLSNLNGYYYDYDVFDGFEPDFIDNPNIAPEAVEGMMKDLAVNKALGLSADDLEDVLPEAIRHDPEGMTYINYSAIIPVLIEAFKEQQARIDQLEAILKKNGLVKP